MTDCTQTTPTRDEAVLYARYEPEWGRMMLCNRDQFGAVEYRLASAPAPASGGVEAVAVKALEWKGSAKGNFFAHALWGTYSVERHGNAWVWSCHWKGTTAAMLYPCASEDEGKAGAQADHDKHIRSALSPAATPVSEAGGEAAKTVPRNPTDQQVEEIVYNINRKRRGPHDLTPGDVREVVDNLFFVCATPASSPAGGDVREALEAAFDFLGGVDGASEVRDKLLASPSQSTSAGRVGE